MSQEEESLIDRIRDSEQRGRALDDLRGRIRPGRTSLIIGAVAGLLLGLVLGLLIGWVLWPVEYTSAWPQELAPEAKAAYIAAVADAYVAARSEQALHLAEQRLAWFGAQTADALAAAQEFYAAAARSDSNVRVTNIEELAFALDPVSPPVDTQLEEVVDDATVDIAWLQRLLWLLTAFVLIAGGIWVLRAVHRASQANSLHSDETDATGGQPIEEYDENTDEVPPNAQPQSLDEAFDESISGHKAEGDHAQDRGGDAGSAASTTPDDRVGAGTDGRDDAWDDDALDPGKDRDGQPTSRVVATSGSAGVLVSGPAQADPEGYGFDPELETAASAAQKTTIIADIADEQSATAQPPDSPQRSPDAAAPAARDAADVDRSPVEPTQRETVDWPEVDRFTARFQPALDEYEEAFTINHDGGYVGDCGMGVNMKHGLVLHNPEHVSVLDVWLVDAPPSAETAYHDISLLSKHGVKSGLEQKLIEGNSTHRVLATPTSGATFQIKGDHLAIDGKILDVRYAERGQADGVFSVCEVEMIVRRR